MKTDEPDPDTGYNFGVIRQSRKIIAWGGTSADDAESGLGSLHRIWFHDLSAGPELWTDNWNINDADVDGNGVLDYRMPPVWEYGNPSADIYRPFNDLSGDLGKVARYVALDLLFTSSPLYKPALSPPGLPSAVQVDINLYQGDPGFDGKSVLNTTYVKTKLGPLQPLNSLATEVHDQSLRGRALSVYQCFVTYFTGPGPLGQSCFGNKLFGIAFGDLFIYHDDKINQFIEGDGDYEVPVFLYSGHRRADAGQPARVRRRQLARRHAELRLRVRHAVHPDARLRLQHDHHPRGGAPRRACRTRTTASTTRATWTSGPATRSTSSTPATSRTR